MCFLSKASLFGEVSPKAHDRAGSAVTIEASERDWIIEPRSAIWRSFGPGFGRNNRLPLASSIGAVRFG
jgi:hypothetical protein